MRRFFLVLLSFGMLSAQDGFIYQFQGRATRAGGTIEALGGTSGGGGGFTVILGHEPLRMRLRMDGDTFPGNTPAGPVNTYGLGMDALLVLPTAYPISPFLSVGPAFEQWNGQDAATQKATGTNKLAFRAEAGVWIKERFGLYVGALTGQVQAGRRATCPYAGLSFNF